MQIQIQIQIQIQAQVQMENTDTNQKSETNSNEKPNENTNKICSTYLPLICVFNPEDLLCCVFLSEHAVWWDTSSADVLYTCSSLSVSTHLLISLGCALEKIEHQTAFLLFKISLLMFLSPFLPCLCVLFLSEKWGSMTEKLFPL